MRINESLENILNELEKQNGDNVLNLLTVVNALEIAYQNINNCVLADEKDFKCYFDKSCQIKKIKYDADKGKNIYKVFSYENYVEEQLFNIEVSNVGEISFDIIGEDKEIIQSLIDKLNEPNSGILEQIKMNSDVSFFTQNRELVISTNPYLAIKMGNFIEGDNAVLVYMEEASNNELNKTNAGLKYIRIDQIEGYLKNIKIDERKIPILAYAFFNKYNIDQFKLDKVNIMSSTYPYLTEEKVKLYKSYDYMYNKRKKTIGWSSFLSVGLGVASTAIALTTPLPDIALIATGFGMPIFTGSMYWLRQKNNERRASRKDDLLDKASFELYGRLKKLANEKAVQIEREMSSKKTKKNNIINKNNQQELLPSEIITKAKSLIKDYSSLKQSFYLVVLNQLENAYGLNDNLKENEEVLKDENLFNELYQTVEEIHNLGNVSTEEIISNTLASMRRLVNYGNSNKTIENINDYTLAFFNVGRIDNKERYVEEIKKLYLEAFLVSKAKESNLSVQIIASIPENTKDALVEQIKTFAHRLCYLDDDKSQYAENLTNHCNRLIHTEVKIVNLINEIYDKNLSYDLLGKNISKTTVKVKENNTK